MSRKRPFPAPQSDGDFSGGEEVTGGKDPMYFFKIILASMLQDNKLGIPNKFAREFSRDLSSTAKIVVPASRSWTVSIGSEGGKFWFCGGLKEFFKFYSVSCGYFLVFDYRGNSVFGVRIFDLSACEISYPSNSASRQSPPLNRTPLRNKLELPSDDDEDDDKDDANWKLDDDDDDDDVVMVDDPPVVSKRAADLIELSSDDDDDDQPKPSASRFPIKVKTEFETDEIGSIGKNLQKKSWPVYSSFKAAMSQYLDKPSLEVPSDIGRKYQRGKLCGSVTLEVSDGRRWTVEGNFFRGRLKSLGKGWAEFVRDNKLKARHTCVFELVEFEEEFRLKVSGWTGIKNEV